MSDLLRVYEVVIFGGFDREEVRRWLKDFFRACIHCRPTLPHHLCPYPSVLYCGVFIILSYLCKILCKLTLPVSPSSEKFILKL